MNTPLTKDDFINSHWQNVIESSKKKDCLDYSIIFRKRSKETNNIQEKAIFDILALATGLVIDTSKNEDFFIAQSQKITDEQLRFFAEIINDISDPELQARVADILWMRRYLTENSYQLAELAISAYLKSAINLENPENTTECFSRIQRAFKLAFKIRDNNKIEQVINHIKTVIDRDKEINLLGLSGRLMKLLQEQNKNLINVAEYIILAEKLAKRAEVCNNWYEARFYWEIKAKWHRLEKNKEKERDALMLAAETYIKQAENILKNSCPSYLQASHCMMQAVEAFNRIPGTTEETSEAKTRAKEAHKILLQYQENYHQQKISYSYQSSISITHDEINKIKEIVRGKNFEDSLFSLAFLCPYPKVTQLRKDVQERANQYSSPYIIPKVKINEKGKVIAQRSGSVLSSNINESEKAIDLEMYEIARFEQGFYGASYIEFARDQINLEHHVSLEDFYPIVSNNPFVPPGREYLYAKGLYAGLTGDFITSTHVLIPQIENSIRYILGNKGIITSKIDYKGIQEEHDLNKMLYYPEIATIFDEDILFDLQGLLIEKHGSNLRNEMAHGLLSDDKFNSPIMSYLWWLTLKLCCFPILNYQNKVEQSNPWVKFSGMFKDDPLFDDFTEEMATYRQKLDSEIEDN